MKHRLADTLTELIAQLNCYRANSYIFRGQSNAKYLLLKVLPYVAQEQNFALKGGTAINLFVRNMPRLSVDIDLSYLPFDDREHCPISKNPYIE